jgi:hypothetical protein
MTTQNLRSRYKCGYVYCRQAPPIVGLLIPLATMVLWQRACCLLLASIPLIDAAALSVRDSYGSSDGLHIETSSGTVQGFYNNTAHTVRAFLGVPFAAAPTGSLRFMPPAKRARSDSVIQATAWPPSCPGIYTNDTTIYSLLPYLPIAGFDEDCLTANIWTPSVSRIGSKRLPVMIYIYGGGFDQGGTSIPTYEATDLVANHGDVSTYETSGIPSLFHLQKGRKTTN